ncbi:UNVERIFIED_CONTAM: hypothetical protein Slati_2248300 [Sesamum latifolium]|uniref:Uncharacterized protein n=1 Tax=Sesamum latifolium TaxID=2727402 RepID=A0AAW2WZ75_9LAMI
MRDTLSKKEEAILSNSSWDRRANNCLSFEDNTPLIRLLTKERFPPRSTSKELRECKQSEGARETLRKRGEP